MTSQQDYWSTNMYQLIERVAFEIGDVTIYDSDKDYYFQLLKMYPDFYGQRKPLSNMIDNIEETSFKK